jgi:hypothetical protein
MALKNRQQEIIRIQFHVSAWNVRIAVLLGIALPSACVSGGSSRRHMLRLQPYWLTGAEARSQLFASWWCPDNRPVILRCPA